MAEGSQAFSSFDGQKDDFSRSMWSTKRWEGQVAGVKGSMQKKKSVTLLQAIHACVAVSRMGGWI